MRHQVASAQLEHQIKDPHTQPSEPILFPKLRIYFADFPYLLPFFGPVAEKAWGDLKGSRFKDGPPKKLFFIFESLPKKLFADSFLGRQRKKCLRCFSSSRACPKNCLQTVFWAGSAKNCLRTIPRFKILGFKGFKCPSARWVAATKLFNVPLAAC